jgi:hypothetical protein
MTKVPNVALPPSPYPGYFFMTLFKCTQMKFCPGIVPQCPSSMWFTWVSVNGRFSSGLYSPIFLLRFYINR